MHMLELGDEAIAKELREVSPSEIQNSVSRAQKKIRRLLPPKIASRLSSKWSQKASNEDIRLFISKFKNILITQPSAGNVAYLFCDAIIYAIADSKCLTPNQRKLIGELCSVINERPLPTMMLVDFVQAQLEHPQIIIKVLTACQKSLDDLPRNIQKTVRVQYRKLNLDTSRPVFVVGYSAAIVAALQGLPKTITSSLRVLTPRQSLPRRAQPDGDLLKTQLQGVIPNIEVEVIEDYDARRRIRTDRPTLMLMGSSVIGIRETGVFEIVNSRNALLYAQLASEMKVPLAVVAGAYKLWPAQTYERYRPVILIEKLDNLPRYSVVPADLVTWVVTGDELLSSTDYIDEYESCFNIAGIPLTAIRNSLNVKRRRFKHLAPEVLERTKAFQASSRRQGGRNMYPRSMNPIERLHKLPGHFLEAQRYYATTLRKDNKWMSKHLNNYVAIVDTQVVDEDTYFQRLASRVQKQYGFGPIFMPRVTEHPEVANIGPRTLSGGRK